MLNDGAMMMLLLYGVLFLGPIALIIYLILDNKRIKEMSRV
jgi:hypothetical protein